MWTTGTGPFDQQVLEASKGGVDLILDPVGASYLKQVRELELGSLMAI